MSYMKAGLVYADIISTVSETYADEIQTEEYGYGFDGIIRAGKRQVKRNNKRYRLRDE